MRAVGYVRVSTSEQRPGLQRDGIRRYAAARHWRLRRLYEDLGRSGAVTSGRPALARLLQDARRRAFDAVIVWKFDRLARSAEDLLMSLRLFKERGIQFVSVTEGVDTSSPLGQMVVTLLGAVSDLERTTVVQRIRAGIAAKRRRAPAAPWGRPTLVTAAQAERMQVLRAERMPVRAIARTLGLPRTTVRRALAAAALLAPGDGFRAARR